MINARIGTGLLCLLIFIGIFEAPAVEPGDVIINEVYFGPRGKQHAQHEAVELLVVADKVNLNGLQVSDRNIWDKPSEGQCTLNDLGQQFLSSVRSGTLIVIYDGKGKDEINTNDFVLRFYTQSSLYCNTAPGTNGFSFVGRADNLHLLHLNKQIDFMKYQFVGATNRPPGDPGKLYWEKGVDGYIEVDPARGNAGVRFLGGKADLNDYPAAWQSFAQKPKGDTLGKPNGGANTQWIEQLRRQSRFGTNTIVRSLD